MECSICLHTEAILSYLGYVDPETNLRGSGNSSRLILSLFETCMVFYGLHIMVAVARGISGAACIIMYM